MTAPQRTHFQRAKVLAVEAAVRRPGARPFREAERLAERVSSDWDMPLPAPSPGDTMSVGPDGIILPRRPRPITVLHALAHILTNPVFPAHGAEFCATWLALAHQYDADGDGLEQLFIEHNLHYDPYTRAERVRRNGAYFVRAMPGVLVELVMDDPPVCGRGSIEACDATTVRVGGEDFPLARARYLERA